jgi:hypothetical protein
MAGRAALIAEAMRHGWTVTEHSLVPGMTTRVDRITLTRGTEVEDVRPVFGDWVIPSWLAARALNGDEVRA